jgi:hypothetical protein
MAQGMANSADGEIILKLYELRTEPVMRQARAWLTAEFWPDSFSEFNAIQQDHGAPRNCWLRQVVSYWEMAASLVLHGSLSAELFVDCNSEPFFILAKLTPLLPQIQERWPDYFAKTIQLIEHSQSAALRYQAELRTVDERRKSRNDHE